MTTANLPPTGQLKASMHDQTLVLTLSNPEQRNALSPAMYAAGVEALLVASDNPAVRSVILTGEGQEFCAGGNLQRLLANRAEPPEVQAASVEQLHAWIDALRSFPKPVVAAVEGAAAGAGFSLALACDLLVASDDAVFVAAYVNVALSPDGGMTAALADGLPRQLAAEILMGGDRLSAQRLHGMGLVNRLAPPGQALAHALAWCAQLNAKAPNALESIKHLLALAPTQHFSDQLRAERGHFVANLHHANGAEGIAAFLAKRPAQYR